MKITRKLTLELFNVLNYVDFEMPISSRFSFMVTRNIELLQKEVDATNKAYPEPESVTKVKTSIQQLLEKFQLKTLEDGAKIEDVVKLGEFNTEYDALKPSIESADADFKVWDAERNEFLAEEIDLNLDLITIDKMPDISKNNKWPHWEIWSIVKNLIKED